MRTDLLLSGRPEMVTERLCLRRPDERDVDAIVSIVGDLEISSKLTRVPHPYGPDDARYFLEEVVPNEWVWAITIAPSDELVGVIGLTPEVGMNTAELGYWLSFRHWNCGIATEAARSVVSFGFDRLGLPYLTSGYFEDNAASGRVLGKLGFIEDGRAMRRCLATGGDVAVVRLHLPRTVWKGEATGS